MKGLVVIPARGGSKGIPRKNVRLLAGFPLISYSINTAIQSVNDLDVVVSTEDDEIIQISKKYGAKVIVRPDSLSGDDVTLDPVIFHAVTEAERTHGITYDFVITMQATSPLLTKQTLDSAIQYFLDHSYDSIISVVNKPHLSWTVKEGKSIPNYTKRLNRQQLPVNFLETGAFFISRRFVVQKHSRLGALVSVFEIPEVEAIDIDSPQDWWVSEIQLKKKHILIRVDGYSEIGLGHIYRALLLGYNLIEHEILFVLSQKSDLGIRKIEESNFPYEIIRDNNELGPLIQKYSCDILLNDILNTEAEYIQTCKSYGIRVINFEDLGPGAAYADAVINDLYSRKNTLKNHYWGSDYYCLRDEFLLADSSEFSTTVREILVIFGGTDPCDLTQKVIKALNAINTTGIHITCILGMGYKKHNEFTESIKRMNLNIDVVQDVKHMSQFMKKADLAVSSQGRTMLELASMRVPTILMSQNERETHHEFGYLDNGFINLGLGASLDIKTIQTTLQWIIQTPQIRKQMREQMEQKDLKLGIERVMNIILNKEL